MMPKQSPNKRELLLYVIHV